MAVDLSAAVSAEFADYRRSIATVSNPAIDPLIRMLNELSTRDRHRRDRTRLAAPASETDSKKIKAAAAKATAVAVAAPKPPP